MQRFFGQIPIGPIGTGTFMHIIDLLKRTQSPHPGFINRVLHLELETALFGSMVSFYSTLLARWMSLNIALFASEQLQVLRALGRT